MCWLFLPGLGGKAAACTHLPGPSREQTALAPSCGTPPPPPPPHPTPPPPVGPPPPTARRAAYTGKTGPLKPGGALMLGAEQDCYGGCLDRGQVGAWGGQLVVGLGRGSGRGMGGSAPPIASPPRMA